MARIEKVNQNVKKEIGYILQEEIHDPRLEFVTITDAQVSRDLQHARVYFSVLGERSQFEAALESLRKAKGRIRRFLGERLKMRYVPDIEFFIDKSVEYGARIERAIEDIHHEFGENQ